MFSNKKEVSEYLDLHIGPKQFVYIRFKYNLRAHVVGIYRDSITNTFSFFDPNSKTGEVAFLDLDQLTTVVLDSQKMFENLSPKMYANKKFFLLGVFVFAYP